MQGDTTVHTAVQARHTLRASRRCEAKPGVKSASRWAWGALSRSAVHVSAMLRTCTRVLQRHTFVCCPAAGMRPGLTWLIEIVAGPKQERK